MTAQLDKEYKVTILNERIESILFKISDFSSRALNTEDLKVEGYNYLIEDLNNEYNALNKELALLTQSQ